MEPSREAGEPQQVVQAQGRGGGGGWWGEGQRRPARELGPDPGTNGWTGATCLFCCLSLKPHSLWGLGSPTRGAVSTLSPNRWT